jgi:hypothetical protein
VIFVGVLIYGLLKGLGVDEKTHGIFISNFNIWFLGLVLLVGLIGYANLCFKTYKGAY